MAMRVAAKCKATEAEEIKRAATFNKATGFKASPPEAGKDAHKEGRKDNDPLGKKALLHLA
jgi:hypothetical protein